MLQACKLMQWNLDIAFKYIHTISSHKNEKLNTDINKTKIQLLQDERHASADKHSSVPIHDTNSISSTPKSS